MRRSEFLEVRLPHSPTATGDKFTEGLARKKCILKILKKFLAQFCICDYYSNSYGS
jgi:hypothetical protein